MLIRCLFIMTCIFATSLSVAQETTLASTTSIAVEKPDESAVSQATDLASEPNVEVGRHVMGNIDAGSMILSLLAVLVAIVIAAWLLKKFQVGGTTVNGLKIVTSLSLGAKERIVVVQVGEKQLLLGVTGQQINLLDTLAEPLEIKSVVPIELSQTLARFSRNSAVKANR